MTDPIAQSAQITRDVTDYTAPHDAWTVRFLLDCATRRAGFALQALNHAMTYPAGSVSRRMRLRDAEDWITQAIQDHSNAIGCASK